MLEVLKSIATALILAGICAIGAWLLKTRKQQITAIVTDLIQKAESAIQGSGMGAEKKAKVIAQLEAMGITVTGKLDKLIDSIVAYLNKKSAWFVNEAAETSQDAVDTLAEETSNADS